MPQVIQAITSDPTPLNHIKVRDVTFALLEDEGPFWKEIDGGLLGKLCQRLLIQFAEREFVTEEIQNNCMGNSICVHEPAQVEELRIYAG